MREKLVLDSLGKVKRKKLNELYFDCPFCDDTKGHLGVNIKKKLFHCFKCSSKGRIFGSGPTLDTFQDRINSFLKKKVPAREGVNIAAKLPEEYIPVTPSAGLPYRYLMRRQVTYREIKKYRIGYCSSGIYAGRIILPVYDSNMLLYYTARTYTNRHPKYLNAVSHKGGTIFKTFDQKVEMAAVVEGIFGALRVSKVMPAIALLGKQLTIQQAKQIFRCAQSVIVCLDPDATIDAMRIMEVLNTRIRVSMALTRTSPDEMNENEIELALKH